jgi:hypothetical protein
MSTIFVQFASYRDPQLTITISDLLEKADNPHLFSFGICWQYDETENISLYDDRKNFRIKKVHYSESQGLGWARAECNKLYEGEELTLQLDSHHRFLKGWDTMMLEDFKQSKTFSKKPVLTTYLTPFEPQQTKYEEAPCLMSQYEFSSDKLLMSRPHHILDYKKRNQVIKARTISGHFFLADGSFIKDVPYDPDIYFGGYTEETTLSVRAFTNGYDFYSPYRQYIWHEYTRKGRPKHWEDHGTKDSIGYAETKKTSGERDIYARKKTRQLFGQEENGIDMGFFGLGKERSLYDYERFGGFDFKKCRIQDYTLKVKEPPNPSNWEEQFISNKYSVTCEWDVDFFKRHNFKNPKCMTFGLQNKSGAEIFRNDFTIEKDKDYVNLIKNKYIANFQSIDKPNKIVMFLFDEDAGWSERYEKEISPNFIA